MLNFNLQPDAIASECEALLATHQQQIEQLLDSPTPLLFHELIAPLEAIHTEFHHFWSPISHLNSVQNSDALREAYNQCLPQLSAFSTWLSQNERLYHAMLHLQKHATFHEQPIATQTFINNEVRDFELSGIHLAAADKALYGRLQDELSALTAKFEENLLDATDAWELCLDDASRLQGLPESALQNIKTEQGYRLNLQAPCYIAVLTHASDRALRETLYNAYVTRASDQGDGQYDNSQTLFAILSVRQQLAQLLGFAHYSDYSLATKMANTTNEVLDFLNHLLTKAKPFAEQDMKALTAFAKEQGFTQALAPWDIAYYSEQFKKAQFAIDDEQLRVYFPIDATLKGLFEVCRRLYGLQFEACPSIPTWHPDVRVFKVLDKNAKAIAYFYLDLYARAKKRGGAWMDDAQSYYLDQLPIAYLTCNFMPAAHDKPALLTHDDVVTLFHEFGHGLHHMLTQVNVLGVSGIHGVSWDAVELPSQILENWCWQESALHFISHHYQTGAALPPELLTQLLAAKNFQAGMFLARQLEFALFDFELHQSFDRHAPYAQIQATLDRIRQRCAVTPVAEFNRFQHSFSHIFAGGYGAGYYSYLWAEVLAADAFSKFLEDGIFNAETGNAFRQAFLAKGGSEPAAKLFADFRGRAPDINALLVSYGLS